MGEKGKLFYGKMLIDKCRKKMVDFEIHHFANATVVTVAGKNHFWMLK